MPETRAQILRAKNTRVWQPTRGRKGKVLENKVQNVLQKQKECRFRKSTVSVPGKSTIIVRKIAIASGAGGRIESRSSRQEIPVLNRQLPIQDASRTSIGPELLLASGVNQTVINDHAVLEDIGKVEAKCAVLSGSRNPIVDDSGTPTPKGISTFYPFPGLPSSQKMVQEEFEPTVKSMDLARETPVISADTPGADKETFSAGVTISNKELLSATSKASKFNVVSIVDAASSSISWDVHASPLRIYEVSAATPQGDASGLSGKDFRINACNKSASCTVALTEQSSAVLSIGVAEEMRDVAQ